MKILKKLNGKGNNENSHSYGQDIVLLTLKGAILNGICPELAKRCVEFCRDSIEKSKGEKPIYDKFDINEEKIIVRNNHD